MMMEGNPDFGKEEAFLLLLEQLTSCYAEMEPEPPAKPFHTGIEAVCAYLDEHYASPTSLEELARLAGMNKYSLLRAFTRSKGITPYRYLETVRVSRAKRLLEQGMEPADVALQTGFSDQSHFSNYFKEFIGLTPGQYRDIFLKSPYESED